MKKGIASILLLLYVAFSSGVVISYHFCMDEFDSVQFGNTSSDICGKCGMHTDKMGCCSDEVMIFKIQDDQQPAAIGFKINLPEVTIAGLPVFNIETPANISYNLLLNNHSPPLSKQHIYLQNCVFRI